MKVLSINPKNPKSVSFGRAPTKDEEPKMAADIQEAKKFLGIKNQALILHAASFPVEDKDLFIGSHVGKKANELNSFIKMLGFDSVQLGPTGLLPRGDNSPYAGSSTSENYLFSDMTELTKKEYGHILSMNDINKEINPDYIEKTDKTDFKKAREVYDGLFEKAYKNLKANNSDEAENLKIEFNQFKKANKDLDSDATYEILSNKFNNSEVYSWPEEYQKYNTDNSKIKAVIDENKDKINLYKFKQFIIDKQEKAFTKTNPVKYIADNPVSMSWQSVFAHGEAFLKDFRMGTAFGGQGEPFWGTERGACQLWGLPALDPRKLFKEDGSLDVGGQLIHNKFEKFLKSAKTVRVDAFWALMDAWLYNVNTVDVKKRPDGSVYSTSAVGANISKFGKKDAFYIDGNMPGAKQDALRKINEQIAHLPNIDPNGNYPKIFEKIILPVLREHNVNPEDLVCENIGTNTDKISEVCNKEYDFNGKKTKLPNISNITWDRGQYKNPEDTYIVGSHDDDTFTHIATNEFYGNKKTSAMNPDFLVGWLYPDKNDMKKAELKYNLSWDTKLRVKTMFQELFRCSKKMEISFMDFFGLDKRLNTPGVFSDDNWALRLTKDFKAKYFERLEKQEWNHHPINVPEMLERAVISKAYTNENYKSEAERNDAINTAKGIMEKMSHWKNVLYEKTPQVMRKMKPIAKKMIQEVA